MGGFNLLESKRFEIQRKENLNLKATELLKSHPNYKDQEPLEGESVIAYTLRCAAHIVSPPQEEGESYDIECTTIKAAILGLEKEIEERLFIYRNKIS